MRTVKKIIRIIYYLYFFILGNVIALFVYDRKYLRGRHFENKYFGIGAVGWRWVCFCAPFQTFFGINSGVPWPVNPGARIGNYKNIIFDCDNLDNFQSCGVYFQASGAKLVIGKGTYIAPNVGLINQNHNVSDPDKYVDGKDVIIGEKCWIGMGAILLPGVVLGPHTTVGAGSIVTKSFEQGNCIIAGNPARIIKTINVGGEKNA